MLKLDGYHRIPKVGMWYDRFPKIKRDTQGCSVVLNARWSQWRRSEADGRNKSGIVTGPRVSYWQVEIWCNGHVQVLASCTKATEGGATAVSAEPGFRCRLRARHMKIITTTNISPAIIPPTIAMIVLVLKEDELPEKVSTSYNEFWWCFAIFTTYRFLTD